MQHDFSIPTRGQGLYEFTRDVQAWVAASGVRDGLLTLFVRHTSCSLLIQENADPEGAGGFARVLCPPGAAFIGSVNDLSAPHI